MSSSARDQLRRQPAAARRRVLEQVERGHVGHARAAVAVGELELPIGADLDHVAALDRRRRRGEDDRHVLELGAHHRDVAGVILDAVLLLEARLVRLVDDDQAELAIGQEQGRAGADHDPGLAAGDGAPGAAALRLAQARMPGHRIAAEARGEALEERLGERDFGQQDERLPARADRLGDRLEIDFGLARAGDAVEQEGREAGARRPPRASSLGRVGLGLLERGRVVVRIGLGKGIVDRDLDRLDRAGLARGRG